MMARRFPLLWQKGELSGRTVSWELAERAYAAYSARYGTDQSLNRIAERGGFSPGEMDMFVPGWREDS